MRSVPLLIDTNLRDRPQFAVACGAGLGDSDELRGHRRERDGGARGLAGALRDRAAPRRAVHRHLHRVADRPGDGGPPRPPPAGAPRPAGAAPRAPLGVPACPAAPRPAPAPGPPAASTEAERQRRLDHQFGDPRRLWQLDLQPLVRRLRRAGVPAPGRRHRRKVHRRRRVVARRHLPRGGVGQRRRNRRRQLRHRPRLRALGRFRTAATCSGVTNGAPELPKALRDVARHVGDPLVGVGSHRHHHAAPYVLAVDVGRSARAAAP